jgi:hypothetical protein
MSDAAGGASGSIPVHDNVASGPKQQELPPEDGRRGYVRLASMDGKTITHKVTYWTIIYHLHSDGFSLADLFDQFLRESTGQLQERSLL